MKWRLLMYRVAVVMVIAGLIAVVGWWRGEQNRSARYSVLLECVYKPTNAMGAVGMMGASGVFGAGGRRVEFEFLGHEGGADRYSLAWTGPDGEAMSTEIEYRGEAMVIYEDAEFRISAEP